MPARTMTPAMAQEWLDDGGKAAANVIAKTFAPVLVGPNEVERPLFPSPPEQSRIPTMDCPKCGAAAMMYADDAGVRLSWACQCGQIRALMSGIAPANWRQGRAQALIGGVWQDVAAVRYMGDE